MGDVAAPVVWLADDEADHCAGCSVGFSFTMRKHLCRMCGAGFCARCSASKRPVPWRGFHEPVRVCDMCVQAADRTKRMARLRATIGNMQGKDGGSQSVFNDDLDVKRRESNANFLEALKRIYNAKIRPLEQAYKFAEFYNSELTEGDFDARPMVLLIGQYSVGKTSFIRYLLERDFPGQRIGPEPTTDRFVAVMEGKTDRIVPGNAAGVDSRRPFSSLGRFGTAFLNRFEVAELSAPILDAMYLVDTPGILSGEKQRLERGYNFEEVVQWFAERADRILMLFDAHKLDVSDELKRTIQVLKPHEEKIRIVLNKADTIDSQQLMRVYGALMWSLGKVVRSPEVLRVYIGSFWDKPLAEIGKYNEALFAAEKDDLISDLRNLPNNAAVRKVNELVKRARLAKVHAMLLSHLRSNMPYLWGHQRKHKKLVERLDEEYRKVAKMHDLAAGDFPPIEKFRQGMQSMDSNRSSAAKGGKSTGVDQTTKIEFPSGMDDSGFGKGDNRQSGNRQGLRDVGHKDEPFSWGDFDGDKRENPFAKTHESELDGAEARAAYWVVSDEDKRKADDIFYKLGPAGHPPVLSGVQVRPLMVESGLPTGCLRQIWDLADIEAQGTLDMDEFALALHLISLAKSEGAAAIPKPLPAAFIPPGRR